MIKILFISNKKKKKKKKKEKNGYSNIYQLKYFTFYKM